MKRGIESIVAEAIYEAMPGKGCHDMRRGAHIPWSELTRSWRYEWMTAARAAIKATKQPRKRAKDDGRAR